jgi:hypothetical protein
LETNATAYRKLTAKNRYAATPYIKIRIRPIAYPSGLRWLESQLRPSSPISALRAHRGGWARPRRTLAKKRQTVS